MAGNFVVYKHGLVVSGQSKLYMGGNFAVSKYDPVVLLQRKYMTVIPFEGFIKPNNRICELFIVEIIRRKYHYFVIFANEQ